MPIITFWSDIQKETGQTASAIATATQMAIDHNNKILLLSTYYNNDDIRSAFWSYDKGKKGLASLLGGNKKVSLESGIQGLAKVAASNKLTPELITNYTKIVFKGRLEILEEYKENDYMGYEIVKKLYPDLIKNASLYYDYVIVDLEKGYSELTEDILSVSDLICYSMNQKITNIDSYLNSLQQEGLLKKQENKIIPFVGRYDAFSKYNTKNISRYIRQKKEIDAISYNTLFGEALNEGSIADFFLKIRTVNGTDRNTEFLEQVRKLSDHLIYRIQEIQMKRMQF